VQGQPSPTLLTEREVQSLVQEPRYRLLVVGGSAGSFPIVSRLLEALPSNFRLPIVLCLHRLKDKREGFKEALEVKSTLPVREAEDKDLIEPGVVFVAPANYHLLVEPSGHFALATTELVQYSRPSIDVLFESVADVFGVRALAVLLSGANRDGASGMLRIRQRGGLTIAQEPSESTMATMPEAALSLGAAVASLTSTQLIEVLKGIK
jgi:two-component system chemotaxis response regulator CheB